MCISVTYQLVNYKVQCKIQKVFLSIFHNNKRFNSLDIKEYSNYWVHRNRFVYIIFNNGHVNITKIRSFSEIQESLNHLLHIYNFDINDYLCDTHCNDEFELCSCVKQVFSNIQIDNVTIYGELFINVINLTNVKDIFSKKLNICIYKFENDSYFIDNVKYDIQFFPGLFTKIKQETKIQDKTCVKKWGTIIFFSNGKFTIVGIKNDNNISELVSILKTFITQHGIM